MTDLETLYLSSRFDAPGSDVATALKLAMFPEPDGPLFDVIGLDEIHRPDQHAAVRALLEPLGYRVLRRGQYIVAWRKSVLKPRTRKNFATFRRLSFVYGEGKGSWQDPRMLTVRLTDRATGMPVTVDVIHAPSAVEFGTSWRPGKRTKAHKAAYARYKRIKDGRGKRVTSLLMDDSNVNSRVKVWRDRMLAATGLPSVWDAFPARAQGTHRDWGKMSGTRCIDRISSDGKITSGGVLPWPPRRLHLDHRAVWARVRVPKPHTH